ncbi:MAG TPA: ATP-binding protein [Gammaproteobacteria bacterium]|jgi:PAS domain S-box-containing protein
MALGRRLGRALLVLLSVLGVLVWGVGLLLFSQVVEDSDDFARYAVLIVSINAIGVAVLLALIGNRLVRLIRDYRRFVPGSRLQARMVTLVGIVAAIPLVILYMFAVAFIARGIDEWFTVDVGRGLEEALELTEESINLKMTDSVIRLEVMAGSLNAFQSEGLEREFFALAGSIGAIELTLFDAMGELVATAPLLPAGIAPSGLDAELLEQLPDVRLEFLAEDILYNEIRAVVAFADAGGASYYLRGRFAVPPRIYELITSVEARQGQFARLALVRTELKLSLALTLTLVLLIAILSAVYTAFFVAQRLILPIQKLMEGTRAVARGELDTQVPLAHGDEIGFLVNSFNDMTRKLAQARQTATDSERRLEDERNKLEVILARLSTGVVSLESDLTIRTANKAAGEILGVELEQHVGESLIDLVQERPLLRQFLEAIAQHLEDETPEWRDRIALRGEHGSRELVCACSELPIEGEHGEGYILVFDDITALMRAQEEAAWGEVARRLAHEIKNPLTPIQLSAERVRRRYLADGSDDLDLLDRATHTIIQQVDSMKGMVDAFSEYARAPDIELGELNLNALISEVTELYRHQVSPVRIELDLAESLPPVKADIGRLRQVIHNLLRNASEAIEGQENAEIEISTRQRELADIPYAEIIVGDNGPGFSADILDKAFLPYVTSKAKGTGLGLAIVRKLVEEHGGEIRARNKAQRGAEVSILLPLHGADRGTSRRAQHRRKRA